MSDDDIIGSITGTATFDWVEINPVSPAEGDDEVRVIGVYMGDSTVYQCDRERVRLVGLKLRSLHDTIQIEPTTEDGWVWVEATEDHLFITDEEH